LWDGSFANNAWLQELPKPFTKLTWGNAALVSPTTAEKLGARDEDVMTLEFQGRAIHAPILVVPGLPEGVVTVHLGHGPTRGGSVGAGGEGEWDWRGFDAYRLRRSDARWSGREVKISRTGRRQQLVMTRSHHAISDAIANEAASAQELELRNRRLIRAGTLA